jgi:hypothetical protein
LSRRARRQPDKPKWSAWTLRFRRRLTLPRLAIALLITASALNAAEVDDKDLQIMQLQKIIAEQTMQRLLENRLVAEYERIRANHEALLKKIAEREKAAKGAK